MSELYENTQPISVIDTENQSEVVRESADTRASRVWRLSDTVITKVQEKPKYIPLQDVYVKGDEGGIASYERDWLLRGEK